MPQDPAQISETHELALVSRALTISCSGFGKPISAKTLPVPSVFRV
jgi:hypothetical protein